MSSLTTNAILTGAVFATARYALQFTKRQIKGKFPQRSQPPINQALQTPGPQTNKTK